MVTKTGGPSTQTNGNGDALTKRVPENREPIALKNCGCYKPVDLRYNRGSGKLG